MTQFGFCKHAYNGRFNSESWFISNGKEFWLIFNNGDEFKKYNINKPKKYTWIEYCPCCGINRII